MPLRLQLAALVGFVLLVSLVCGSVLAGWHAAGSVQTELRAALDVGANTIRNGYDDLAESRDRARDLRHLVATFNGNRHVRAMLLDARDQPAAASRLLVPAQPAPHWFVQMIAGEAPAIRLPVPLAVDGAAAIVLQTDPTNETGEIWTESRDEVLVLAGFAVLSALLVSAVAGRALRSLENLSAAFEKVGNGNYQRLTPPRRPPELARLARGFNLMTQRLIAIATQNRRLNERLLTLQAEERAELARDLHDEIGPMLFAVDMTAATIERLATSGRGSDVPPHVRSIHDAVGHMQRHVRAILERLRPLETIGLAAAIDRLVAFWHGRRPEIDFLTNVGIEDDRIGDDMKETIYRMIQEGVSNAIRHGRPTRIDISITHDGPDRVRVVLEDDGIGLPADRSFRPAQFGLIGMRERVMAMAGSLSIQGGHNSKGLTLVACLPCAGLAQPHGQDILE